jgi:cytosine/adenosine deaminase-related metal-dependent hydrolase
MTSHLRGICVSVVLILGLAPVGGHHIVLATPSTSAILLEGTIVTMNAAREIIHGGRVLVRDGRIAAVWRGSQPPDDVDLTDVARVPLSPHAVIYPGLINLHDHPFYDVLPVWQPPSSHRQATLGRPLGTEAYGNRYQWNTPAAQPAEGARLTANPSAVLTTSNGLGRLAEVIKFGKARMILGGTTTTQGGGSSLSYDSLLARNVENVNFGRRRIFSRVPAIGSMSVSETTTLLSGMSAGLVDAWLVHLAEGVRDSDRPAGDVVSSRAEFIQLQASQLLNDATVIVHGVALESADFAAMAAAPPARADGVGDGHGAKLVWSPLSNLLLYGRTTAIHEALAAGVLISLGTDWTPSGSPNLLTELKVADRVLRDARVLDSARHLIGGQPTGGAPQGTGGAERDLDQMLVEMVTINPAMTVRWDDHVGSIEAGKAADLLVIQTPPATSGTDGVPHSPYRRLINATEQDVALVLVAGIAQAGEVDIMAALKPGDYEVVHSAAGCFEKAIDVTSSTAPNGNQTLSSVMSLVADGLRALGGDHPPSGGGPSSPFVNTWSYLKARIPGASMLPDLTFNFALASAVGMTNDGNVNLEAIRLPPLFTADDEWWFATLEASRDPVTGVTAAPAPYAPYPSNANHVTAAGNPFAAPHFRERWYSRRCQ